MKIFHETHTGLTQEAPGSDESSLRALNIIELPKTPAILDVGCGPGRHTNLLAKKTGGFCVAVDIFERYLKMTQKRVEGSAPTRASMSALPFAPNSFDLIWSEGAIYIMGFSQGIKAWKPLLRPKGHLVLTEACWFTDSPPPEAREFWDEGYPAMQNIEANVKVLKDEGFEVLDLFPLPASDWWAYYDQVQKSVDNLRNKYADDKEALAVLDIEQQEINLYRQYGDTYGYAFFVAQRGS